MTVGRFPDKPTPIGCLVGFLALFPTAFSLMAFWAASKAFAKTPPETDTGKTLIMWGFIAAVPAILGVAFCIFRIVTIGKRDHFRIGKSLST